MNADDFFKLWDKLSSVKPDFILFVGFLFLIFKFKDVVEVYFRIKLNKSMQLREAKSLLELSGHADSKDMEVINNRLRGAALSLITNGVKERHRTLCYYLMHLSAERGDSIDSAIYKCIAFIASDAERFYFNQQQFNQWQIKSVIIALLIGLMMLIASSFGWGDSGAFKLSWLMNAMTVWFFVSLGWIFLFTKPDSGDITLVTNLLADASVADYNQFKRSNSVIIT
ncbi:hypothetical protein BTJ39_05490 [Izhakiella australiensis]|uniref:Uncharacterized protein n=1 Tax=Izhakiella australiensis TaxID=1926881 RepID=A0A1S8YRH2_9GAMM|nr:hypothetical protein [Izhakiella australiensis]OON41416.1 hypothetical protein BTJ39_05490 [Izhakiella australiensis]